jgi:hypothetical protein
VTEHARIPTSAVLLVVALAILAGTAGLATSWWMLTRDEATAAAPVGASATVAEADGWAPWGHNDDGQPVRWDPCSPIEVVVDPDGAYAGFRRDLHEAVADVEAASGLEIDIVGETSERPDASRPVFQPDRYGEKWAPVLVAFATPGENDLPLTAVDRGLASPVAVGPAGDRAYVTGQVVLNVEREELRAGAADRAFSWGSTLRHELGHLVGLAHVDDEDELMHVHPGDGTVAWGDGDRRGLEAIGAGPCRDVPAPRLLDVEMGPPR